MFPLNESTLFSQFAAAALKSTAVLGVAWLVALVLRRRSAAARHVAWTAALSAILLMPLLALSIPGLQIPARVLPEVVFQSSASVTPAAGAPSAAAPAARAIASAPSRWVPDWRLGLLLLWGIGAANSLAQMLAALAAVRRARRSARRFDDSSLCRASSRALGIERDVEVLEGAKGSMPMTFGIRRPVIFMPSDAAHWTEDRRRIVLLHELAHVRRGDGWLHWIARTALALYWWNPLAWKAWREFLDERERAADDLVLNSGASASAYADHLLCIARSMRFSPGFAWAAVSMARQSQLEGRLKAILDSRLNRTSPGPGFVALAVVASAAVVAPLAALRAQDTAKVPADVEAAVRAATSQQNYEMLEDAANDARKQGKLDTAHQLLEPAVAIRAAKAGEQSVQYAAGLLKLGDLESLRGNDKSAEDFYARAAQILGDKAEAAPALMYLGKAAMKRKDYSKALEYFQRAQTADPANAGVALMWTGVAQQSQNNMEEAETAYKNSLLRQEPNTTAAAATMSVYARFLRKQSRDDEATDLEARALAIQKANAITPKLAADTFRIGPGIAAPKPLQRGEPGYSEDARLAQLMGTVVLSITVGADGLAHDIKVVRGLGLGLDEKAAEAVGKWTFQPGTKDGQPVPVAAIIEVNFRLL
jgi:TonB family protein